MHFLNRREFLQDSTLFSAALAAARAIEAPALAVEAAKKAGPNDQLRVAVVGVRNRGLDHVKGFAGKHNCIVATGSSRFSPIFSDLPGLPWCPERVLNKGEVR